MEGDNNKKKIVTNKENEKQRSRPQEKIMTNKENGKRRSDSPGKVGANKNEAGKKRIKSTNFRNNENGIKIKPKEAIRFFARFDHKQAFKDAIENVQARKEYVDDMRTPEIMKQEFDTRNKEPNIHFTYGGPGHEPHPNAKEYRIPTKIKVQKVRGGDESDVSDTETVVDPEFTKGVAMFNCLGWGLGKTVGVLYNKQDFIALCSNLENDIETIGAKIRDGLAMQFKGRAIASKEELVQEQQRILGLGQEMDGDDTSSERQPGEIGEKVQKGENKPYGKYILALRVKRYIDPAEIRTDVHFASFGRDLLWSNKDGPRQLYLNPKRDLLGPEPSSIWRYHFSPKSTLEWGRQLSETEEKHLRAGTDYYPRVTNFQNGKAGMISLEHLPMNNFHVTEIRCSPGKTTNNLEIVYDYKGKRLNMAGVDINDTTKGWGPWTWNGGSATVTQPGGGHIMVLGGNLTLSLQGRVAIPKLTLTTVENDIPNGIGERVIMLGNHDYIPTDIHIQTASDKSDDPEVVLTEKFGNSWELTSAKKVVLGVNTTKGYLPCKILEPLRFKEDGTQLTSGKMSINPQKSPIDLKGKALQHHYDTNCKKHLFYFALNECAKAVVKTDKYSSKTYYLLLDEKFK